MAGLAYATKNQMAIWKVADRSGDDKNPAAHISLKVTKDSAALYGGSGLVTIKRDIMPEAGGSGSVNIPWRVVQQAEKSMASKDRAYLDHNEIRIVSVTEDEKTEMEVLTVKAVVPFKEQLELSLDIKNPIEQANELEAGDDTVLLNLKHLRALLDQFKHGSATAFVHLSFSPDSKFVKLTAWEDVEAAAIHAAVMPLQDD